VGNEENQGDLDVAHQDVGNDLPQQHLERTGRHGEQVLHGAPFPLSRDGQPGDHHHGHGEDYPQEAGDDIVLGDGFRVVAGVNPQVHRAVAWGQVGQRPLEIVLQGGVQRVCEGVDGVARGRRIRCVRFHQEDGAVSPQKVSAEVLRNVDHELHPALGQDIPRLRLRLQLHDEIEIGAVPDGMKEGSGLGAVVGLKNGRRQVLGVRIDGKAEKDQLQERNSDHHPKG